MTIESNVIVNIDPYTDKCISAVSKIFLLTPN